MGQPVTQQSQQIEVSLNPQIIQKIMQETGQKWRDCRRKAYNVYAIKVPANYVFANRLEQPVSYKCLKQRFKDKLFVDSVSMGMLKQDVAALIKQNGYYCTDGTKIVLCGTQGELWDVKPEKLVQSYRMPDGSAINLNDIKVGEWFTISRAGTNAATEVGIQIPAKYYAQLQLSWGTLYMNDPNSQGHYKGDILVCGRNPDGTPNYNSISPINNGVFANTFDQTVGGWGKSGAIMSAEDAERNMPTIEDLKKWLLPELKF